MTLAHGSPRAPVCEYVGDPVAAGLNFDILPTDCGFVGHTHAPAVSDRLKDRPLATHTRWQPDQTVSLANRRLLLNPGSVGQPRDGDPRASLALYDTDSGTATLHRTPYDVEAVQAQMHRIGLPAQFADRLAHGR